MRLCLKLLMLTGLTIAAIGLSESWTLRAVYCNTCGTPADTDELVREVAVSQLEWEGADPTFIAHLRRTP